MLCVRPSRDLFAPAIYCSLRARVARRSQPGRCERAAQQKPSTSPLPCRSSAPLRKGGTTKAEHLSTLLQEQRLAAKGPIPSAPQKQQPRNTGGLVTSRDQTYS